MNQLEQLKNYQQPDPAIWQGRIDDKDNPDAFRFHQVVTSVSLTDLPKTALGQMHFCILGFCCDEGVKRNFGRTGAAEGPAKIRAELAKLPANFIRFASLKDVGNITCENGDLKSAQYELSIAVEHILDCGHFPIVLGGGHEIVYGHYAGLRKHVFDLGEKTPPLLINLDAHFDLRPINEGATSGTSFNQIALEHKEQDLPFEYICIGTQTYGNTRSLYNRADELKVKYYDAKDINDESKYKIISEVLTRIGRHQNVYLTLDFDCINAANAPGVSSPQPFGLHPDLFLQLVKPIIASGKVRSFDIAEVAPRYDDDNQTAKLAAIVIYALMGSMDPDQN